jgi:hypothetical protein
MPAGAPPINRLLAPARTPAKSWICKLPLLTIDRRTWARLADVKLPRKKAVPTGETAFFACNARLGENRHFAVLVREGRTTTTYKTITCENMGDLWVMR